jgi:hypothetical protein
MKKGQIILGVASALITVGSGLAFKVAHKFTKHAVYGKTAATSSVCKVCRTWFTNGASLVAAKGCKTAGGVNALFTTHRGAPISKTFLFTNRTVAGVHCGADLITKVGTDF